MSGYLEVKYPFKSNLGLNPFKSWKRQWCILRPSPTFSGGILAVYCSEAGTSAGTIELPSGFVVRRAKSRTRPHAFAVFPIDEPRKPRVLLAASTLHDAQAWMEKIKAQINGNQLFELDSLKDTFSVTVTSTDLSRKCGLSSADCTVSVTPSGVLVSHLQKTPVYIQWKHVIDTSLGDSDRNGTCILTVNSGFIHGSGSLRFTSPLAGALVGALRRAGHVAPALGSRALSKSDGQLDKIKCSDGELGEMRCSSWYSGPSEVSLDDLDLVMSKKGGARVRTLPRSRGAGHLPAAPAGLRHSISDRRSMASIASGIYEEIPDLPAPEQTVEDGVYCKMNRDRPLGALKLAGVEASLRREEPAYESVAECVYATLRRARRPPPLPPRARTPGCTSVPARRGVAGAVTRHGSLGCLPPNNNNHNNNNNNNVNTSRTLPRWDRSRHAFSAFRKRLKSDSRVATSPKSETAKEKDVETKKKKFDFTPTRDIFKSFKVSRKMKNLKIASGGLTKGETKSCEFLDETVHVTDSRCSKSVECLENEFLDEFDTDLSIEYPTELSIPQEIVELILKGQEQLDQITKAEVEGDYLPMSPIVPMEHHYLVMSPRTNMA